MKVEYTVSVFTPAGWRGVRILALAERISAGMVRVLAVTAIDGETPAGRMSRTGARRQQYSGSAVAAREVGARKRLSACHIVHA